MRSVRKIRLLMLAAATPLVLLVGWALLVVVSPAPTVADEGAPASAQDANPAPEYVSGADANRWEGYPSRILCRMPCWDRSEVGRLKGPNS